MQTQNVQRRFTAWLLSAGIFALNAFVVPAATSDNVLCFGDDGHVAVASKSTDGCCDRDAGNANHLIVFRAADTGPECVDCIDLPLPDGVTSQLVRTNSGITFAKNCTATIDCTVAPVKRIVSCGAIQQVKPLRLSSSITALRSVSLLI